MLLVRRKHQQRRKTLVEKNPIYDFDLITLLTPLRSDSQNKVIELQGFIPSFSTKVRQLATFFSLYFIRAVGEKKHQQQRKPVN